MISQVKGDLHAVFEAAPSRRAASAVVGALPSHRLLTRTEIWHCSAADYAMTATVSRFMAGGISM